MNIDGEIKRVERAWVDAQPTYKAIKAAIRQYQKHSEGQSK